MNEAKYRAFISYSHEDSKWAEWLHRSIESYRPPKRLIGEVTRFGPVPDRLAPVFRDRAELPTATDLGEAINDALEQSACQIVICSPAAANSRWVNEEILAYKKLGREDRVFCLIVDGEPNADERPDSGLEECFPEALRYKLGANGTLSDDRAEPIAADVRADKDSKADAKLKIIAGMLGVGLDALKQREHQRRQRRLAIVASAATVGMIIATTLATVAIFARAEAERQRVRAEAEAVTAQQTANFLVELFAVSDPSEALGNTITAREILDQGARRIEFELEDQPAIRSTLLDTMGTVYMRLGLYDDARKLLDRSLTVRQSFYGEKSPEVARSQASLGLLLGSQSELEAAEQLYQQAIAIQRGMSAIPISELAISLEGLAEIRSLQSDPEGAEELFREAFEIRISADDDESLEVAEILDGIGMSLYDQGKYDEAERILRDSLAMRRTIVPGGVHPDLDDGLNNLAVILYEAGQFDETESLFRESLTMKRHLYGDSHPVIALGLNNLAILLHDNGDYDAAEVSHQEALTMRRELLGEQHPQVGQSLNNLALLYEDMGETDRAIETSKNALAVYRGAYPGNHRDIAWGLQNLAGLLAKTGDDEAAEPLIREALKMHQALFETGHPEIAIAQGVLANLLLRKDQMDAALGLAQEAHQAFFESYGPDHFRTNLAASRLGLILTRLSRYAEAEPLLLESFERQQGANVVRPASVAATRKRLVALYTAWGRPDEATRYATDVGTSP